MIGGDSAGLRAALAVAIDVPRVLDEVVAQAPFASLDELLAALRAAATPLSGAELDQALAHHPRIGERPAGAGAASDFSRREQASADADDPVLAERIAAGNAAYEARFGRVFLIRAASRSRAEILAELERRLRNDPEAELEEAAEQLRQIASLRLAQSLADQDQEASPMSFITSHVLDTALGQPASGIPVALVDPDGAVIATGETDADGRVAALGPDSLPAGIYRLEFEVGGYLARTGSAGFYPRVTVEVRLDPAERHYHLPLLLSPFGYSTYRGS